MTEDEAKTKWCPFSRVISLGAPQPSAAYNRHDPTTTNVYLPAATMCVGSQCMAWRLDHPTVIAQAGPPKTGECGLTNEKVVGNRPTTAQPR